MLRKIIQIDEEKCNGCGLCAAACHEGAIGMVNGKAHLLREDYCDGLGDCLPACPAGAITFEEREAAAYNAAAVKAHFASEPPAAAPFVGCPGSRAQMIHRASAPAVAQRQAQVKAPSRLMQWPVQIRLAPVHAPYFDGADLLVSADCASYACGNFHEQFMKDRITLIGCPKLDAVDYSEKLTAILQQNAVRSVTVVRMEVPCCGGLEYAVRTALKNSEKVIPWQVVTLSTEGSVLS